MGEGLFGVAVILSIICVALIVLIVTIYTVGRALRKELSDIAAGIWHRDNRYL